MLRNTHNGTSGCNLFTVLCINLAAPRIVAFLQLPVLLSSFSLWANRINCIFSQRNITRKFISFGGGWISGVSIVFGLFECILGSYSKNELIWGVDTGEPFCVGLFGFSRPYRQVCISFCFAYSGHGRSEGQSQRDCTEIEWIVSNAEKISRFWWWQSHSTIPHKLLQPSKCGW